jgi:hypothetical protein
MKKIVYEYGAMSSKFSCEATNKLTAYVAMVAHYDSQAHLLVIYSPEECKADGWFNLTGKISEKLDKIFGGEGAFDKYVEDHVDDIKECFETIKRIT